MFKKSNILFIDDRWRIPRDFLIILNFNIIIIIYVYKAHVTPKFVVLTVSLILTVLSSIMNIKNREQNVERGVRTTINLFSKKEL